MLTPQSQEVIMDAKAVKQTHPILIIAGIAVTIFSLAGVAAIMGWIPTSKGQGDTPVAAVPAPVAQAPEAPKVAEPASPAPAAHPAKPHVAKKAEPRHEQVARAEPAAVPPPVVAAVCRECGVIEGVHEVEKAGQGTGGGAIAGGIVGGVAGHQMGSGRGKDLMTVLGAVGGAVAGNAIEKKAKTTKEYEILVRFEDGSTRIIKSATQPTWRAGDKVKVIDGVIQSNG
jgi:outer membrane lipoprotein SlyB